MTNDEAEAIALHRWAVIAEAANARLGPRERGMVVRAAASRDHAHPDNRGYPEDAHSVAHALSPYAGQVAHPVAVMADFRLSISPVGRR